MSNEWRNLPDMLDVARVKDAGWEIEAMNMASHEWFVWDGRAWNVNAKFRGRPAQPKKVTVTSECWRDLTNGNLFWCDADNGLTSPWQRFPVGDKTGDVEE